MLRRRIGFFPSNVTKREVVVAGQPPIVLAEVAAFDATAALGLDGLSGRYRGGISSGVDTSRRWAGYLPFLANLGPVGASTNLRTSPPTAFPKTSGPIDYPGSVSSSLAAIPLGGSRG